MKASFDIRNPIARKFHLHESSQNDVPFQGIVGFLNIHFDYHPRGDRSITVDNMTDF